MAQLSAQLYAYTSIGVCFLCIFYNSYNIMSCFNSKSFCNCMSPLFFSLFSTKLHIYNMFLPPPNFPNVRQSLGLVCAQYTNVLCSPSCHTSNCGHSTQTYCVPLLATLLTAVAIGSSPQSLSVLTCDLALCQEAVHDRTKSHGATLRAR